MEHRFWGYSGCDLENRNELVFSQKSNTTVASIMKIRYQVEGLLSYMLTTSVLRPQFQAFEVISEIYWSKPPRSYWKLNCDGSVLDNGRSAGCGGIL